MTKQRRARGSGGKAFEMTDQEKCQHCGVPIIPGLASEGAGWYHDRGENDPASPYVNCFPTTVAEPPGGCPYSGCWRIGSERDGCNCVLEQTPLTHPDHMS